MVRAGADQGSALAIALTFLMLFGVLIGVILQFAVTGQRTAIAVREEATSTYAGGGALDGAVNAVRSVPYKGLASSGVTSCFTLPAGALDNASAITVRCSPRSTSGDPVTGSTVSQPDRAVITTSTVAGEGLAVVSGSTRVVGGVGVTRELSVASGAVLDSSGYPVEAGTCPASGTGQVKDECTVAAVSVPTYPGPATTLAAQRTNLPACGPATLTLSPGIYRSAGALQAVLNCANSTIVLTTGTYFFDFQDAGTHELVFDGASPRNAVLIGGAVSGTACDPTAPGVDLTFGGDSRLRVQSGRVDLCSLVPNGDTSNQHIVLRGLSAPLTVPTTSSVGGASATSVGGTAWTNPNNGAAVNTPPVTTTATIAGNNKPDAVLRVALPASVVPTDAQNISATITVRESVSTTNTGTTTTAELRSSSGATLATLPLTTCSSGGTPCNGVLRDDTTTAVSSLTAAQLNGSPSPATVDVRLSKPGGGTVDGAIDGVILNLSYDLPVRPACQLASPTGACLAGTTPSSPLLTGSGPFAGTRLTLHGTVYAPTSSVDLGMTGVTERVVDRGLIVRHLRLSMTAAAGYSGPLISIPDIARLRREVVLVATDTSGAQLGRAYVHFHDAVDATRNGAVAEVREWSVG